MQGKEQSAVVNTSDFAPRRNVSASAGHYTYNPCKENYFYYLVCPVWGVVVVVGVVCLSLVSAVCRLRSPAFSLFLGPSIGFI